MTIFNSYAEGYIMIYMSHNPLHPPSPTTIDYFQIEDLQSAVEVKRIHVLLDNFLFYSANPYQTPQEKQYNWNNFFKVLKEVSNDIITLRRRLHMERSRPSVTNIKDVKSFDFPSLYPINTKDVNELDQPTDQ